MEVALGLLALVAGSDVTASARASRPDIASYSIALSARACLIPSALLGRTLISRSRTLVMPTSDPQPLYIWSTVFATDRDLELRRAVAEEMIAEGKVDRADLQRWQEGLHSGVQGCIVSFNGTPSGFVCLEADAWPDSSLNSGQIGTAVGLAISFPVLRLYPVRSVYLRLPMRALSTFSGGAAGFTAVSYHQYRQYGYVYSDDEIDRQASRSTVLTLDAVLTL
jgi:hypothetical protein